MSGGGYDINGGGDFDGGYDGNSMDIEVVGICDDTRTSKRTSYHRQCQTRHNIYAKSKAQYKLTEFAPL
jgi:hypothetical protein